MSISSICNTGVANRLLPYFRVAFTQPRRLLTDSILTKQHQPASKRYPFNLQNWTRGKSNKKLPFDVETNIPKDTLVFSCHNDRFYRLVSIFGAVQFVFWAQLAVFAYSGMKKVESEEYKKLFNTDTFWGKVIEFQNKYSNKFAFLCAGLGYAVLFFTWIYPQRSVHKLILQKGGQMVDLVTYTHLGKTRSLQIPLNHINCLQPRTGSGVQTALKVKGRWFYFLMDKRKGTFHDTQLFDYVVGLKRKI